MNPGDVVERLPRRLAQGGVLLDHAGVVEGGLHVEDGLLAALQHRVEAAQHGHGQDHVAVLAAHVEVAEHIVGDPPDVVRDPVQVAVAHVGVHSIGLPSPCPDREPASTAGLRSHVQLQEVADVLRVGCAVHPCTTHPLRNSVSACRRLRPAGRLAGRSPGRLPLMGYGVHLPS